MGIICHEVKWGIEDLLSIRTSHPGPSSFELSTEGPLLSGKTDVEGE